MLDGHEFEQAPGVDNGQGNLGLHVSAIENRAAVNVGVPVFF